MRIDDLLAKYFEGETTREEERELKQFFRKSDIPEEYKVYHPLFAFFDEETKSQVHKQSKPPRTKCYFIYTFTSIAAGLLIILSITGINKHINQPDNYVVIDGHRSTDIQLAREQALAAFSDVSFSREEIFENLFNE